MEGCEDVEFASVTIRELLQWQECMCKNFVESIAAILTKRGVNRSADRWISAINRADSRIWKIPWIAGQLKVLAQFPDSVSLEVRIVDRIINFRSALVNVLVFCRLTFHFRGFRKRLSRYPTHTVYMYSSRQRHGNDVRQPCAWFLHGDTWFR